MVQVLEAKRAWTWAELDSLQARASESEEETSRARAVESRGEKEGETSRTRAVESRDENEEEMLQVTEVEWLVETQRVMSETAEGRNQTFRHP